LWRNPLAASHLANPVCAVTAMRNWIPIHSSCKCRATVISPWIQSTQSWRAMGAGHAGGGPWGRPRVKSQTTDFASLLKLATIAGNSSKPTDLQKPARRFGHKLQFYCVPVTRRSDDGLLRLLAYA
jgi:hypothetical protein